MDTFNNSTNIVHETGYDDMENKTPEKFAWKSAQIENSTHHEF
jgi:hypothetical protein